MLVIKISKEEYLERKRHRMEVVNALKEFLDKPSINSLIRLWSALWASEAIGNKEWFVRERILKNKTPDQVAELLKEILLEIVLNESLHLSEKVDKASIPGFDIASLSEILYSLDPNEYPLCNKRTLEALKKLGIDKELGIDLGHKSGYFDCFNALSKLAEELEHERAENSRLIGEEIPRFEFIDYILNGIYEGKIFVEEVNKARSLSKLPDEATLNHTIEATRRALEQYLYWIKQGQPEDEAIERAVSYTLGWIESSSVLLDKKKTEKFKKALHATSRLLSRILELLEKQGK